MYLYNPRRVLTNKMGGVEPETNIILLDFFQKFTAHWFFIFGISWFFLGPLDFTDFTGDLRLVTLPAVGIWSNLGYHESTVVYLWDDWLQNFWGPTLSGLFAGTMEDTFLGYHWFFSLWNICSLLPVFAFHPCITWSRMWMWWWSGHLHFILDMVSKSTIFRSRDVLIPSLGALWRLGMFSLLTWLRKSSTNTSKSRTMKHMKAGGMHLIYRTVNHHFVKICSLISRGNELLGNIQKIKMIKTTLWIHLILQGANPTWARFITPQKEI